MDIMSRRHEVEAYAHVLRARLQLAGFKALHGVGKASFTDLTTPSSTSTATQPLTTSLAENQMTDVDSAKPGSAASTPALSQSESMPSSSQSSTRSTRSIYMDIFGADFRSTPASSTKGLSRATSFASTSTPSKRPAPSSSTSTSNSTGSGTRSLLDKAASSPQLGSPERKNGRFDWHNNPTAAMVAQERLAAEEPFALPTGSPSKRRREASNNPTHLLPSTPRKRMQSSGFLPNGHPASSLAQDLGLTTPRTPRSRHASGRHVFALQPQAAVGAEDDQAERDRVANTLAALAEARNAGGSSDSSSGSDRPHTPPPPASQGLGIGGLEGFASPSVRRGSAFAQPVGRGKRHQRNVSWSVLPADLQEEVKAGEEEGGQDRAAADYLLFLASSPSPSSIKRFSSDTESLSSNGILSTPAQTSLWDPFKEDPLSGRRSRMHSTTTAAAPMTPPPSHRKPTSAPRASLMGLGFDDATLSASSSPIKPAANAEEYMLLRTPRSPRTPPPSTQLRNSATFDGFFPSTPPAPGGDTNFSYADFVNVSPSPQPPSTGRFPGKAYMNVHHRTPTKSNRFRFDRHT